MVEVYILVCVTVCILEDYRQGGMECVLVMDSLELLMRDSLVGGVGILVDAQLGNRHNGIHLQPVCTRIYRNRRSVHLCCGTYDSILHYTEHTHSHQDNSVHPLQAHIQLDNRKLLHHPLQYRFDCSHCPHKVEEEN